ncbi:MAG: endolytic transglycosylase MltG [Succinivibrio sp.]|nr:endolytic transglycosylase MltG [Succinivibrio sp.]
MTKSKKFYLAFFIIILVSVLTASYFAYESIEKLKNSEITGKTQVYELKKGATTKTVINDLLDNPWDRLVARVYLRFSNPVSSIQKGEYLVGPNKSFISVLKDMSEGNVIVKTYPTFTIVEGTNLSKIIKKAERFKNKLTDDKFFSSVSKEASFIREILKDNPNLLEFIGEDIASLEGLISPATYPLYEKEPFYSIFRQGIISQLKLLKSEWENRDESNNIKTPYEALILASLIEKETFLDEERTLIAAVFENRLSKGMRLQTDPSVMYGVSRDFSGTLKKSQLKADSPYNTYTRDGLPPTPICMPQAKSIRAALHPENTKALYFVAKGISPTEGHVFTNNLNDHNKAVFEYRKKVKNYKLFDEKGSDNSESSVADSNGDDTVSESAAESDSESEKTACNNKTTPELKDDNSSSVESSKAETPESESKAVKADSPKESKKTPSTKSSKNK